MISSPAPAPTSQANHTPAYMLVCLDNGERGISGSDLRIARYQRAIDTVKDRFKIPENMVSDQTWVAVESLRKQGVKTSAIEIMEGVIGMKNAQELGVSYAEIVAMLMTIMQPKSAE